MSYDLEFSRSLVTHLNRVLDVVESVFEQAGVTLPERRFIALGQTVHDCEQVSVSFQQLVLGPPGDAGTLPQRCDSPRSASVLVEVVRCIPVPNNRGGAPTVEQITTAAQQQAVDAWMLMEAATQMDAWTFLADVSAGEPQGDKQAMVLSLTMVVE